MAPAAVGRRFILSILRKNVCTVLLNWHLTAFTLVPSREGVKVEPSQIPRTMLPLGLLAVFRVKLLVLICLLAVSARYELAIAYCCAYWRAVGKKVSLKPSFPAPARAA